MSITVGSIVEGKVTGITHFGAFVELAEGVTGLVHISEVSDSYVKDVKDHIKENETIKVKVLSVQDGKIGLSIRRVENDGPRRGSSPPPPRATGVGGGAPRGGRPRSPKNFEDKLARFMKESDERQQDLKRSIEAKRGGRGAKKIGGM